MCHIIYQSDDSIFLNVESLEDGRPKYKYFVGYKKFTLNTREKIFRLEPYRYYQSGQQFEAKLFEDGIRLELENAVQKQDLLFCIRCRNFTTSISSDPKNLHEGIWAGIHVCSFPKIIDDTWFSSLLTVDDYPDFEDYNTGIVNLVVAFEEDVVVFFDGENISVKRLTILDSDKYRLEEVNNQNLIEFFKGSWRFASVFLIDEVKQY